MYIYSNIKFAELLASIDTTAVDVNENKPLIVTSNQNEAIDTHVALPNIYISHVYANYFSRNIFWSVAPLFLITSAAKTHLGYRCYSK